jgi:hypothetical protein
VQPLIVVFGGMVVAMTLMILLVGAFRPRTGRQIVAGSIHTEAAGAEIEAVDIDQMVEALGERRRRAGRPEIGDELAREALGRPPAGRH